MHKLGRLLTLVGLTTVGLLIAPPAVVQQVVTHVQADAAHGTTGHGGSDSGCGKSQRGERDYEVIFDGSRRCFQRWR